MGSSQHRLTGRDRMILSLLARYGCVSASRIKEQFWKTPKDSQTHYRRIGLLRKLKLLEVVRGPNAAVIGYRLTRTGKRLLKIDSENHSSQVQRKSYQSDFEHDQLLIDLEYILKASPLVEDFKTEAEIRKSILSEVAKHRHWESVPSIPDASFVLKFPQRSMRVALELELTPKIKRRYGRIFRSHLLSKNWDLVIYVVKTEHLRKKLMRTLNDIKERDALIKFASSVNGVYFCALDDLQQKKLEARLTNGKREFSLEEIAQSLKRDRNSAQTAKAEETA